MRPSSALNVASIFLLLAFIALGSAKKSGDVTELQIGVKYKPKTCDVQAHKGDSVKVHYRGKLTDCTPQTPQLRGVFLGWDQGILGMCLGEKRKLKIPSKLGGATLIFDTELVGVNGKTLNDGKSDESEL
ncbi:FK506-binding protein 2 [Sesamum angolense]|uniref:peptidylprolyl isomerase n=1 Tax=Sesamum angolense TaxID=2727404 RepID=A0AAE1XC99_9LAMI|nr:FK506-binding protein 2 [Sesamum angolense]